MKKNGFVSMTLVVTFLVLFLFLMLAILLAYSQQNRYIDAIDKNINVTIDSPHKFEYCPYSAYEAFNYDYTGTSQKFVAGCSGQYKIELWGANGAGSNGGKRAYTSGIIRLKQNDELYIYVGEEGKVSNTYNAISFNGNIQGVHYSGGGATDIRLKSEDTWNNIASLTSRIMVAAGGGGSSSSTNSAGNGGDTDGFDASSGGVKGGARISGQTNKSTTFGVANASGGENSSSGGGGFFAGGSGTVSGGGSSYISGHIGCIAVIREGSSSPRETKGEVTVEEGNEQTQNTICTKDSNILECSIHYSNRSFTSTEMKTGTSVPVIIDPKTSNTPLANYNHGYAKIIFISEDKK